MVKQKPKLNRLSEEKSPYLLEHADDPVDWYPWSDEAFEKAKKENRPVFLSIGYSACHWCHVMQNESFKDPDVAKVLNSVFICIKVDREERPDIDNIFMKMSQMMTGGGGWPLNVVMTYDKKPIFIASYLPKTSRHGMIGVLELSMRIKELWDTGQTKEIQHSGNEMVEQLKELSAVDTKGNVGEGAVDIAYSQIASTFDEHYGGFGSTMKFPMASYLLFLTTYHYFKRKKTALSIVERTLNSMRAGGVYDQIGFGFFRYATDREWKVPHFEKMLYDQALMVSSYIEAYNATGNKEYERVADEICEFLLREMRAPKGAFYTSIDADSDGEEGKFYLWTADDLKENLNFEEAELAMKMFNITEQGNYVDPFGRQKNKSVPSYNIDISDLTQALKMDEFEIGEIVTRIRMKLLSVRAKRKRPKLDDKILADMNGLAIIALSKVYIATGKQEHLDSAKAAADFVLKNMIKNGKLYHSFKEGTLGPGAFLDDYAFLIHGLIQLYEACFDEKYLSSAISLCDNMIKRFSSKSGDFYFTSDDAEVVLIRQKNSSESNVPSGNSVALVDLLLLSRLTGNTEYDKIADKLVNAVASEVLNSPIDHSYLLRGVMLTLMKSYDIVLVGEVGSAELEGVLDLIRKKSPNALVLIKNTKIGEIAGYTESMTSIKGKLTAYICTNKVCGLPTTNINEVMDMLEVKG